MKETARAKGSQRASFVLLLVLLICVPIAFTEETGEIEEIGDCCQFAKHGWFFDFLRLAAGGSYHVKADEYDLRFDVCELSSNVSSLAVLKQGGKVFNVAGDPSQLQSCHAEIFFPLDRSEEEAASGYGISVVVEWANGDECPEKPGEQWKFFQTFTCDPSIHEAKVEGSVSSKDCVARAQISGAAACPRKEPDLWVVFTRHSRILGGIFFVVGLVFAFKGSQTKWVFVYLFLCGSFLSTACTFAALTRMAAPMFVPLLPADGLAGAGRSWQESVACWSSLSVGVLGGLSTTLFYSLGFAVSGAMAGFLATCACMPFLFASVELVEHADFRAADPVSAFRLATLGSITGVGLSLYHAKTGVPWTSSILGAYSAIRSLAVFTGSFPVEMDACAIADVYSWGLHFKEGAPALTATGVTAACLYFLAALVVFAGGLFFQLTVNRRKMEALELTAEQESLAEQQAQYHPALPYDHPDNEF